MRRAGRQGRAISRYITEHEVSVVYGTPALLVPDETFMMWITPDGTMIEFANYTEHAKYAWANDYRAIKNDGDCGMFIHRPQPEDQGVYECMQFGPRQAPVVRVDITCNLEHRSAKINLVLLDNVTGKQMPSPWDEPKQPVTTIVTTPSTTTATALSPVNTTLHPTQYIQVTSVAPSPPKVMVEDPFSAGNVSEVKQIDSSNTIQPYESHNASSGSQADCFVGPVRAKLRRDAKWRAFGFDSSAMDIADPWASRNLWFQQLTHSVRSINSAKGPCILKVPSPSTWPSILETRAEPLPSACQFALSWLSYHQKASTDVLMALSINLFNPSSYCSHYGDLPYINLLDQYENPMTAIPDPLEVKTKTKSITCFCANDTYNGDGVFLGVSNCMEYRMKVSNPDLSNRIKLYPAIFPGPKGETSQTVWAIHHRLPADVTIGTFRDIWWVCGNKAYLFLPYAWTGCCYMATLKLPYEVFTLGTTPPSDDTTSTSNLTSASNARKRRELAQFHNFESYHWRISLGEKWGIGLLPWYGVVFLADHIDNITYTLQGFANETIKGFEHLSNTQRSHRLTLLKHDMALDYILAREGGLCVSLNLTGDACYTLIPDNGDNITSVIDALKKIRDAFGPSESAGISATAWLQDKFGPMGAMLVQFLSAVVVSLSVMFCFCTLSLTCAKAMILRWIGVVMPTDQVQMPLLSDKALVDSDEEDISDEMVDKYPV
uniref:Ig-like domain-containing protein n=1 Tax=Takifugu rubripes TaxID=31033 RepID=A0A674NVC5_TAKRU